ncbi:MAG: YegS/Rv2252/BmrU family lipid kinase [Leptolyngbya sp. DLM2.Bin27]|nr:MAG: YegS/Rv2252/BmrU family lipid kinase [Leptolyngbya sp. DLM2.Bin27]
MVLSAHLIFNPVAGQSDTQRDLSLICQKLRPSFELVVHETQPQTNITQLAQQGVEAGADVVIAAGGDGTVSAVAEALVGQAPPLGVIPRGTANAFATALQIPREVSPACDFILQGAPQPVDVARCNGQIVLAEIDIGFEAEAREQIDRQTKSRFGPLAYTIASARQIRRQGSFQATLETDQDRLQLDAVAIAVANVAPFSSLLAQGPECIQPQDGLLDITVVKPSTYLGMARAIWDLVVSYVRNRPVQSHAAQCLRSSTLTIVTNPPQKVMLDGDLAGTTAVEIHCIPAGLSVYYPVE